MLKIPHDSQAYDLLKRWTADPLTTDISLAIYIGGNKPPAVSLKRNEGMWTAPITVEAVPNG